MVARQALGLFLTVASLLATWVVLYLALSGIGLAVQHAMLGQRPRAGEADHSPWVGFAATLLLLQLWHLALPVNDAALATVLVAGAAGCVAHRDALRDSWAGARRYWSRRTVLGVVLLLAWIALRSLGPVTLHDSGMYHVPMVNWAKAHAIVPGLGNLHGRLAFNPASLLFAAMIDRGPWRDGSQHVANGLLVATFVVHALRLSAGWFSAAALRPRAVFNVAMLAGVVACAFRQDVRSLSTDLPAFILLVVAGGLLFELLGDDGAEGDAQRSRLAQLCVVLAAAVCVKLSAAPFGVAAIATVLVLRRSHVRAAFLARAWVLPAALVITWLARGAMLSGYPLYPSRLLSIPADWRVATEQVDADAAWITMSARNLNTNTIEIPGQWVGGWIRDVLIRGDLFAQSLVPLALIAVGMWLFVVRRRDGEAQGGRWLWLLVPLAISTVAWWITAPHPRMLQGQLWILAAALPASIVGASGDVSRSRLRQIAAIPVVVTFLLATRGALGERGRAVAGERNRATVAALFTLPTPTGWRAPMPTPGLRDVMTDGGVALKVPRVDNGCWNGPILCSPHPASHLEYRVPGEPASGFRLRGSWEPIRFPNPWIAFLPYWRCVREGQARGNRSPEVACRQMALTLPVERDPDTR